MKLRLVEDDASTADYGKSGLREDGHDLKSIDVTPGTIPVTTVSAAVQVPPIAGFARFVGDLAERTRMALRLDAIPARLVRRCGWERV